MLRPLPGEGEGYSVGWAPHAWSSSASAVASRNRRSLRLTNLDPAREERPRRQRPLAAQRAPRGGGRLIGHRLGGSNQVRPAASLGAATRWSWAGRCGLRGEGAEHLREHLGSLLPLGF